jgi:hypothetical protein
MGIRLKLLQTEFQCRKKRIIYVQEDVKLSLTPRPIESLSWNIAFHLSTFDLPTSLLLKSHYYFGSESPANRNPGKTV